jgi:hypothetical protein
LKQLFGHCLKRIDLGSSYRHWEQTLAVSGQAVAKAAAVADAVAVAFAVATVAVSY